MATKTAVKKYFLTVDWCNQGRRGIFCSRGGAPCSQDHPFTKDEVWDILDCFSLVLSPQSLELTEVGLEVYNRFHPLAEFSNQFGIAYEGTPVGSTHSGE